MAERGRLTAWAGLVGGPIWGWGCWGVTRMGGVWLAICWGGGGRFCRGEAC